MKGLLLKDVYQMWYYTRVIILAAVVMMLVGVFGMKEDSNFFMLYGGFLLGIFPMTLLAYDQNSRFSAYSAALPVTKEQLVGSKYLIGLGAMALSELLSMAALAAAQLLWGTVTVQITVATLLQVAMLTLLGNMILLPLTYRFGYEKASVLSLHRCAGLLDGHCCVLRWDPVEQHPACPWFAVGAGCRAGGGSDAVCSLVAAVRCMVRKGRAVR